MKSEMNDETPALGIFAKKIYIYKLLLIHPIVPQNALLISFSFVLKPSNLLHFYTFAVLDLFANLFH